jgi:predicted DNA binding CopG/RHH family protein
MRDDSDGRVNICTDMAKTDDEKLREALRKAPPEGGPKDTQIQIRVSTADKIAWEDEAARRGMTLTAWLTYVARVAAGLE